ncbi:mediator of DNA damage checkpoint protein 1-like, partial [Stegodyphus dumicola]|uniref:mediator of DNA damage checkpoint protein 1-like n=1 Tax=Stegodyphus dumicola TaxID=202533 RepID=UPI0015A92523
KRISQLKQNEAIPVSPKDRYSIYKRFPLSDDPFQEAMKSLEVLKAKSKVKSAKKVRFYLVHDESPALKNEKDLPENLISESRLTNISEKSEENTPIIPEASTEKPSISTEKPTCSEPNKVTCTSQLLHQNTFTSSVKLESAVLKNASDCTQAIRYSSSSTPFVKSSKKENVFSTCSKSASHVINSNHVRHSVRDADRLIPNSLKCVRNESKGLLNSPRPLLLHTQSNHIQDISPEILNKCDPRLLLEAPICTPLVLKGLANDSALKLSPIRQKLDFLEEEDKVAQDDTSPIFRLPSINVEHIWTQKKILDQLADKECGYFLSSAAFPIISGRYLCDPIAHILTEGDEMHFVPVKEEILL